MNPLLYFLVFLKASLFSTGGFGNLPSLHQDLLDNGWATETDFGQALAVGQITPGPNGLWVLSLGYLTYGPVGVVLALAAITIPPFAVLALAAVYRKVEHWPAVRGIMRGLSLSIVGLVVVVAWSLVLPGGSDWRSWLISGAAFGLALTNRLHVIAVLVLAGAAGWLLFQ